MVFMTVKLRDLSSALLIGVTELKNEADTSYLRFLMPRQVFFRIFLCSYQCTIISVLTVYLYASKKNFLEKHTAFEVVFLEAEM